MHQNNVSPQTWTIRVVTVVALVLLFNYIVYIVNQSHGNNSVAASPSPPDLEVLDHQGKTVDALGFSIGSIEGRVRNNTNRIYRSVDVHINLYDKQGNQLGSTLALGSNLEPGSIWKFSAPVMKQECHSYKIIEVTGY